MPLPVELLVPGFRAEGSPKFHVSVECSSLKSLKSAPVATSLPLERFSKSATCYSCCAVHREVANSYRRLLSEGLSSSYPEDADELVVLEIDQAFLPLPPVLGEFLTDYPEFETSQVLRHGGYGIRRPSIRRVPAWVAGWASLYSSMASAFNRNRFRPHLHRSLSLSDEHVRVAALVWQAGMLEEGELQYFQYASLVAAALVERVGLEKVSVAAQLWLESLESDGPITTLPQALDAVDMLTA